MRSGERFNFRKHLFEYCDQDVRILREAIIKFRRMILDTTNIDPFLNTYTIAGLCMNVYKTNFLKECQIGVIPTRGYRSEERQSCIAMQWMKYLEYENNISISHVQNGREVYIGGVGKVDGYREEQIINENGVEDVRKVIYEMEGCFWHGCRLHYDGSLMHPVIGKTMTEIRNETEKKINKLRSLGYEVIEKWECEWKEEIKNSEHIQEILRVLEQDNVIPSSPLDGRDAFYGGRTNATKLYHEVEEGEKILYYDVCSLYPWVNKYMIYPIGHTEVITSQFKEHPEEEYFGLMKCTVMPPRELYHPVLPYRVNGRLTFPLCRTCCEEGRLECGVCNHESTKERALEGTWCTPELKKALEMGYVITDVKEVWDYKESGILFDKYVNTFLKIKVESSGWPSNIVTEEQKEEYLRSFEKREGVQLNQDRIKKNPGLRSLAKLMLNSFWGKWGQKTNLVSHKYVTDPEQYFGIWADQSTEIVNLHFVNEEMIRISTKKNEELQLPHGNVNVVLAAFTTCYARLKLYSYLESLGRRVLYFDTDSVIFTARPDEWCPPLGNFLGDLTDECPDLGGEYIVKFASGGPKCYALEMNTGEKHVKAKGVTLNVRNSIVVNMESLTEMLFSPSPSEEAKTVHIPSFIKRDPKTAKLYSVGMDKKWRIVYTKRAIDWKTFETLPFGY